MVESLKGFGQFYNLLLVDFGKIRYKCMIILYKYNNYILNYLCFSRKKYEEKPSFKNTIRKNITKKRYIINKINGEVKD